MTGTSWFSVTAQVRVCFHLCNGHDGHARGIGHDGHGLGNGYDGHGQGYGQSGQKIEMKLECVSRVSVSDFVCFLCVR